MISLAQGNEMRWPMPYGGLGGILPVSTPPAGSGRTSLRGISTRATSSGFRGFR